MKLFGRLMEIDTYKLRNLLGHVALTVGENNEVTINTARGHTYVIYRTSTNYYNWTEDGQKRAPCGSLEQLAVHILPAQSEQIHFDFGRE